MLLRDVGVSSPISWEVRYALGDVLAKRGDKDPAILEYEKVIQILRKRSR